MRRGRIALVLVLTLIAGEKGPDWDELLGKGATPGTYNITSMLVQGKRVVGKRWRTGDHREQVKRLHEAAVQSLGYFHRTYRPYPYEEYDVVHTGGRKGEGVA